MREFGSDYHLLDDYFSNRASLQRIYPNALFYANGRQCIKALIEQNGWQRIWMPQYFCYEVIETIKTIGVEIIYYVDYPTCDDINSISKLKFETGDVLFRVNYFGLRNYRDEKNISIPVIEDHSHDLLGHWALYSNADWCIASLRKSLPIAEGGMLWSPKSKTIEKKPILTSENCSIAKIRWEAMAQKSTYLEGKGTLKNEFRTKFINTEEILSSLPFSLIDSESINYLNHFDINAWYNIKKKNWKYLRDTFLKDINILSPEEEFCNPFSFIIIMDNMKTRELVYKKLIQTAIYPAILWNIPSDTIVEPPVNDISGRILSIHCDGRYAEGDVRELSYKLRQVLI